jgi:hypothetical protein
MSDNTGYPSSSTDAVDMAFVGRRDLCELLAILSERHDVAALLDRLDTDVAALLDELALRIVE